MAEFNSFNSSTVILLMKYFISFARNTTVSVNTPHDLNACYFNFQFGCKTEFRIPNTGLQTHRSCKFACSMRGDEYIPQKSKHIARIENRNVWKR